MVIFIGIPCLSISTVGRISFEAFFEPKMEQNSSQQWSGATGAMRVWTFFWPTFLGIRIPSSISPCHGAPFALGKAPSQDAIVTTRIVMTFLGSGNAIFANGILRGPHLTYGFVWVPIFYSLKRKGRHCSVSKEKVVFLIHWWLCCASCKVNFSTPTARMINWRLCPNTMSLNLAEISRQLRDWVGFGWIYGDFVGLRWWCFPPVLCDV